MLYDSMNVVPMTVTTLTATTVAATTANVTTVNATTVDATTLTTDTFISDATKIGFFGATKIVQPAAAGQGAVTLGNANSEISGLTISAAYSDTEVIALRDKCEELADDVRALSTLIHALRTALVDLGLIKGTA